MACRTVDQVLERLGVSSESDLTECCHRQEAAQRIECFFLENGILLVEVFLEPRLERRQKRHIGVEQGVHRGDILAKQTVSTEIRLRNVIQLPAADFRNEVDI